MNGAQIAELKKDLAKKGHNLCSFANKHGFSIPTVYYTVRNYWGSERNPNGIKVIRILGALKKYSTDGVDKH